MSDKKYKVIRVNHRRKEGTVHKQDDLYMKQSPDYKKVISELKKQNPLWAFVIGDRN